MLTPEMDIIKRDTALNGLALLFDTDALIRELPHFETDTVAARIVYVRYKPHASCLIAYELKTKTGAVRIYARAHPSSAERNLLNAEGRIVLNDFAVVVFVFPYDKQLNFLRRIMLPDRRQSLLRDNFSAASDLWKSSIECLRYLPERRFVARLGDSAHPRAALKMYSEREYWTAKRNCEQIFSSGVLRIAKPLGFSDRYRIILYEWLSGRLLSEAILAPEFDVASIREVGAALAELHQQPARLLEPLSRSAEIATLFPLAEHVAFICPQLSTDVYKLASMLADSVVALPAVNLPVHGDFYAKQVLLGADSVAIIDFDHAVLGDPAADLGNFIAHVEREAIYGAITRGRVDAIREALLQGYGEARYAAMYSQINLYSAVGLFRLTPDPFRYYEPRWAERTAAILSRSQELAASNIVVTKLGV